MATPPLSQERGHRRGAALFAAVAAVPALLLVLHNTFDRSAQGTAWILPVAAFFVVFTAVGGAFGAAIGAASTRGDGRRVVVLTLLFPMVACLTCVGLTALLAGIFPGESASASQVGGTAGGSALFVLVYLMVYVFLPLMAASGVMAKDLYFRARPRTP